MGDCEKEATENEERIEFDLDTDIEEDVEESEVDATDEATGTNSFIQDIENFQNSSATKNRRPPVWMRNYETSEELPEEENEILLAMFVTAANAIYFEEAVKGRNGEEPWTWKWKQ